MLKPSILVKSGGFSTQLAKYVDVPIDGHPLWGSRFDQLNPKAVIRTHLDFLESGADIIMTNTYQSSIEGYMKHLNLTKEESIQLIRRSVKLAKEAKIEYLRSMNQSENSYLPLIIGSIGPYGAVKHDGSEYNGSYIEQIKKEELQQWHRNRIEALIEEGVDGLGVETIPCQMEAEAITELLLKDYPNVKFWISFQCKDEVHLAHGERFVDATEIIWNIIKTRKATHLLYGIGVNCLHPQLVASLFKSIRKLFDQNGPPLIVYSNRGEIYSSEKNEWIGGENCIPLISYVPEWIQLGARIIGGCCRVYPNDILTIRKYVDNIANIS